MSESNTENKIEQNIFEANDVDFMTIVRMEHLKSISTYLQNFRN
jgi:hypothetical protein